MGGSRCCASRRKWQGTGQVAPRAEAANDRPLPETEPCGKGRLVPRGPGPPQRAIQKRHLVPGTAGSGWALLTARTGAHYVRPNHMGARAARLRL